MQYHTVVLRVLPFLLLRDLFACFKNVRQWLKPRFPDDQINNEQG